MSIQDIDNRNLFSEIYEELSDSLYRHCFFRTSNAEIAEDLVQDVFMKFWRELHLKGEIKYPKAWLYTALRNRIIDYYRKKKTLSLDVQLENGFEPAGEHDHMHPETTAEISILMKKIEMLNDSDKEVIIMRYVDDLPIKEIAEIVQSNENAVSVKLHRAVNKLKEQHDG